MKRASELRDHLGIVKCLALLGQTAAKDIRFSRTTGTKSSDPHSETVAWAHTKGAESNGDKDFPHLSLNNNIHNRNVETDRIPRSFAILTTTHAIYPTTGRNRVSKDFTVIDDKQCVASLKESSNTKPIERKPISPKIPATYPPRFAIPCQEYHSFPLDVCLLPQTFSVHLLTTLHARFQQVGSQFLTGATALIKLLSSGVDQSIMWSPCVISFDEEWRGSPN
jgi:hypothetical protein